MLSHNYFFFLNRPSYRYCLRRHAYNRLLGHGCWSSADQFESHSYVPVSLGRSRIYVVIIIAPGFLVVILLIIIFKNQWRLLIVVNQK